MLALNLLQNIVNNAGSNVVSIITHLDINDIKEAINELESLPIKKLEVKNCSGCFYNTDPKVYDTCNYCLRDKNDYYVLKDEQ
jgi:hypothetical protein